jgi:hypothetical protein
MKRLFATMILVSIGIIGCCTGEDKICSICEQESIPSAQIYESYLNPVSEQMSQPDAISMPSQAYWAWDCFKTCIVSMAPESNQAKLADSLARGCINNGCGLCKSSGITNWPSCIACVGCASTYAGYYIGYAGICAQECLKNR